MRASITSTKTFTDLAVEVLSPDDSKHDIAKKVSMSLAHGSG
jgi:Uma2 family endonuclease